MTTASIAQTQPKGKQVIETVEQWRNHIIENWADLKQKAENLSIKLPYQQMLVIAFDPVIPTSAKQFRQLIKLLKELRHTEVLRDRFATIYKAKQYSLKIEDLVSKLNPDDLTTEELSGLDWVLMATGTLHGFNQNNVVNKSFIKDLLDSFKKREHYPSAFRVQAGMISAGQNVIFAGQNANILTDTYQGDTAKLRRYLSELRADLNMPATNIHTSSQHYIAIRLHQVYTPIDIWTDDPVNDSVQEHKLNTRWYRAINSDLHDERKSTLEAIATYPLLVLTGGAGSGKSTLGQFITTALAYACDSAAEKREKVNGLDLMGTSWIHGELLPIYVSLRDFCNAKTFPSSLTRSNASSLLNYIKENAGSFAPHLEAYLTNTKVNTHGTLLVLDGLDEVYAEKDRMIIRQTIEKWVDTFPTCRVLVTSRTYAYHKNAKWRLSERFKSAELAPFTRKQIVAYIERWYCMAASTRPSSLGGPNQATVNATHLAQDLKQNIHVNKSLLPLARHPLMLALLTLIHEDYKNLPNKRAELYAQTVELLDRWNIPSPSDKLHEKLAHLDLERMRAALKMIAFDLHSQQESYQRYPSTIKRSQLIEKLGFQDKVGDGLGARVADVADYLATRNGILVSDTHEHYRFPHLSIQEYLCACALIEFYDECSMPATLKPADSDGWTFPENMVALLRHDPTRWRNVTIFAGSILSVGMGGQDMRWSLIDELLPKTVKGEISDSTILSISIATEIWSDSFLKPRTNIQHRIRDHLRECLTAIANDQRVDPPDNAKNLLTLTALRDNNIGK